MSKPFSTLDATSSNGSRAGGAMVVFLVLAVVGGIAVFTHGVPPVVGLPIAIVGALLINHVLSGSRK